MAFLRSSVLPRSRPDRKAPQHGFARTSTWEFLGKSTSESTPAAAAADLSVKLDFGLSAANISSEAKKLWPFSFGLIYSVTLNRGSLSTSLVISNDGNESFEFQTLLHTYLRVKVSQLSAAAPVRCRRGKR